MDNISKIVCYRNDGFLVMRKPNGLPTTYGKEICFLDILTGEISDKTLDFSIPTHLLPYIDLPEFVPCKLTPNIIKQQFDIFGKSQELGLLNRLDNETAGFLYFANSQETIQRYRQIQAKGNINKWYIAQIRGIPKDSAFEIDMPIMHHKHKTDRMVFVRSSKDQLKGRSKLHLATTIVKVLQVDKEKNITTLLVGIYKGVRHQIRVHLAGIGYPVVGDTLYGKDKDTGNLCLRSVGFQINE